MCWFRIIINSFNFHHESLIKRRSYRSFSSAERNRYKWVGEHLISMWQIFHLTSCLSVMKWCLHMWFSLWWKQQWEHVGQIVRCAFCNPSLEKCPLANATVTTSVWYLKMGSWIHACNLPETVPESATPEEPLLWALCHLLTRCFKLSSAQFIWKTFVEVVRKYPEPYYCCCLCFVLFVTQIWFIRVYVCDRVAALGSCTQPYCW